VAADL
jgi:hypothetical protein